MSVPTSENATRPLPIFPAVTIAIVVIACMVYANLALTVRPGEDYRYFPPFQAGVNRNINWDLGHEYFNIARALAQGEGFANPFPGRTGPTAWMPPVLPVLLAGLWQLCDGNRAAVLVVVLVVQSLVLIATGLLTLTIARQTTRSFGPGTVAAIYIAALVANFRDCFQANADRWLTVLVIDLLIAGLCWGRPLGSWRRAMCWGIFGGLCALTSPVAGFAWGVLSIALGLSERAWSRLFLMAMAAALTLAPWTIRNYLVFGRWIPVKSNLAYEMYQTHCLQKGGILQSRTLSQHPYQRSSRERLAYDELGEAAYLDRKAEQFREAVRADPWDLMDRIAERFLAATLWSVSIDDGPGQSASWWLWLQRFLHPWPFIALFVLALAGTRRSLPATTWLVIALYLVYLAPYVAASYYERYAFPLLPAKVLLVAWAIDNLISWRMDRTN